MAGTDCRGLAPLINKADLRTIRTLEEKRGGWRGERKGNKLGAVGCFKWLIIRMTWIIDFRWISKGGFRGLKAIRIRHYNSNDRLIMAEKEELLFRCFGGSSPDCRLLFFLCRNNFRERNTGCSQHSGGGTIVLKETHKEALSAGTAPFHLGLSFARHLSVSNVLITAV